MIALYRLKGDQRFVFDHVVSRQIQSLYSGTVPPDVGTLNQILKEADYSTGEASVAIEGDSVIVERL